MCTQKNMPKLAIQTTKIIVIRKLSKEDLLVCNRLTGICNFVTVELKSWLKWTDLTLPVKVKHSSAVAQFQIFKYSLEAETHLEPSRVTAMSVTSVATKVLHIPRYEIDTTKLSCFNTKRSFVGFLNDKYVKE